ncbi:MAG: trehalose-phosphatase [Candidatus Omnitrophica bacterium]|nr:trehalose-phosphatase [Candidatus Omnitrophota bacterium]
MDWSNSFRNPPRRVIKLTKEYLSKVLKSRKRVFIFFDYDGTLSPIVRNPHLARVPLSTKKSLKKLAGNRRFVVGIISGRSLRDVKKRVGLKDIFYAGGHGLEIEYKKKVLLNPKLQIKSRAVIKKAKSQLAKSLNDIGGVVIEDKGAILAVHYRKVLLSKQRTVIKIFKETSKPFLKAKLLKIGSGKKVLELRPNIAFSKADSVQFFHKKLRKAKNDLTLFFGDDLTDEDVFKLLKDPDLGVRIGRSKSSKAKYYLANPRELTQLLFGVSRLS